MLIDEIEGAFRAAPSQEHWEATQLMGFRWWPRIRAAILAAKEMDNELSMRKADDGYYGQSKAQRQFRKAMGE